jgi:hypothetical protein
VTRTTVGAAAMRPETMALLMTGEAEMTQHKPALAATPRERRAFSGVYSRLMLC